MKQTANGKGQEDETLLDQCSGWSTFVPHAIYSTSVSALLNGIASSSAMLNRTLCKKL